MTRYKDRKQATGGVLDCERRREQDRETGDKGCCYRCNMRWTYWADSSNAACSASSSASRCARSWTLDAIFSCVQASAFRIPKSQYFCESD